MAASGETTSTTAAPTVRFSDKLEVFYPEEVPATVSTVVGKQHRSSRRERRNNAQQKTRRERRNNAQQKTQGIERFAEQLTPLKLASELKQYVYEDMEELEIKKQIGGVPNNGRVPFSPMSYCSDCVDRIAAYFKGEDMSKNILENDDREEQQVYIKDVKKLATMFLDVQQLHFYDHVTVEAFNNNAMKRGGSTYGVPLSVACLADATGSGNLYEKLAGKETVCAAFSTGVAMQCGTSDLTELSENNFKTHKQLLEENVDSNTIRKGCSCFKSDEWLKKRLTDVNRLRRQNKKEEKVISWERFKAKEIQTEEEEEEEEVDSGEEAETNKAGEAEKKNDESEEKEKEEVVDSVEEDEEDTEVEFRLPEDEDDGVSSCGDFDEEENEEEEEEPEVEFAEDVDDGVSSCEETEQEDETKEGEEVKESDGEEKTEKYSREEKTVVEFEDVDDYDFRPGNLVRPVEKEEDFDNERWSDMRTTSSCLALCRHAPSCVVNTINKERVLESLMLVPFPEDEKEGIASTTPGKYFTVITHPESFLIFSLGATVYEALAHLCDDDNDLWDVVDGEEDCLASSIESSKKTIAKVYTTVHTVAAPFFRSAPVCYIDQQNKYGYYKTFRIRIPGNFSGCYNDTSIGWRSELYSRITSSAVEAECRGHYSFLEEDDGVPWPRRKPIRVEGGIVADDSGGMSGNYLTAMCGGSFGLSDFLKGEEGKTAIAAYANMRNLVAVHEVLKKSIGELLTGPFKEQLVELKKLDIERTQREEEEAAARGGGEGLTAHETQYLNDIRTNKTQNAKFTARAIERYEKCLKSLTIDLGTMNKLLSYNLNGFMAAVSHKPDIDDICAFYV